MNIKKELLIKLIEAELAGMEKDLKSGDNLSVNERNVMQEMSELMFQYSQATDDKIKQGRVYTLLNQAAQEIKKELNKQDLADTELD
tara:strand:+ start:127 stop:387 length:261 start_codon:yes stop_codon:yes gene_type:complete